MFGCLLICFKVAVEWRYFFWFKGLQCPNCDHICISFDTIEKTVMQFSVSTCHVTGHKDIEITTKCVHHMLLVITINDPFGLRLNAACQGDMSSHLFKNLERNIFFYLITYSCLEFVRPTPCFIWWMVSCNLTGLKQVDSPVWHFSGPQLNNLFMHFSPAFDLRHCKYGVLHHISAWL